MFVARLRERACSALVERTDGEIRDGVVRPTTVFVFETEASGARSKELICSLSAPAEKDRFLELVRANEDKGNDCIENNSYAAYN